MKYEVNTPYLHDGSDKCPLPKGSEACVFGKDGSWSIGTKVRDYHWPDAFAYVIKYIPPELTNELNIDVAANLTKGETDEV